MDLKACLLVHVTGITIKWTLWNNPIHSLLYLRERHRNSRTIFHLLDNKTISYLHTLQANFKMEKEACLILWCETEFFDIKDRENGKFGMCIHLRKRMHFHWNKWKTMEYCHGPRQINWTGLLDIARRRSSDAEPW